MTELISMTLETNYRDKKRQNQKLQRTKSSFYSCSADSKTQNNELLKQFEFIIREQGLPYDIVMVVGGDGFARSVRITLLEKDGNVVKIHDQQSRTFLIQKYIGDKNVYHPSIDPLTGAVCFRLGYFQFGVNGNKQSWLNKEKIIKNLNMDKLYLSIQKFRHLLHHGQQFNSTEDYDSTKKYYQPLTKLISKLDDCQFTYKNTKKQVQNNYNQDLNSSDFKQNCQKNYKLKCFLEELNHHLSSQKQHPQGFNENQLARQLKKIQSQSQNLSQLTKRKQGKSNYQSLLINLKTQKSLKQQIFTMSERMILQSNVKIVEGQLGKITLNLQKQQDSIYIAKKKLLMMLPKNTQYHFLDKYFINDHGMPVLISLSLKQQTLTSFLDANSIVMSLETKMRILVQICSAIQTLWEEKNIILFVKNMRKIFITKNLTVKVRNLSQYLKVETHMMLQEKSFVNSKLIDNFLNMTEIYSKLFFDHNLSFMRPSLSAHSQTVRIAENYRGINMAGKNIGTKLGHHRLPSPMKEILFGLNYLFLQFINKAEQINKKQLEKLNKRQVFMTQEQQNIGNKRESQQDIKLLNFKPTCCWLLKNLQLIVQEGI